LKILIIKHGALGDIILSLPAFAAIRASHADANITLLTTAPFTDFLAASPWFDEIICDSRPEFWNLPGMMKLKRQLSGFDLVYDLQTSSRSSRYFTLAGKPRWSGIAKGCALPDADPKRNLLHSSQRLAGQLAVAGVTGLTAPDLSWAAVDISRFKLPAGFVALVPGAAPHRPEKRWPESKFANLAVQLQSRAVVVGTKADAPFAAVIKSFAPLTRDLTGQTSLAELVSVLGQARLVIGNDTGPMHIAAALGVPSVVLFSHASDPALTSPRYPDGGWPIILRKAHLAGLSVAEVVAALP
jgi:ADP-heptose:LPS heptosyltransferase